MKQRGAEIGVFAGAAAFALMAALSMNRIQSAFFMPEAEARVLATKGESVQTSAQRLADLKRRLLSHPKVDRAHHRIHQEVGERNWEFHVKPELLSAITWKAVREQGTLFPDLQEIFNSVDADPQAIIDAMEKSALRFKGAPSRPE